MNQPVLGIIGGGQLGSMLSEAAKKLEIKTVVLSDDPDAPAKNFANKFIYGNYGDSKIITEILFFSADFAYLNIRSGVL